MNILKNKTIAIVGGGPGGLTLARLLQLKGAHVNVYERDVNKDVRVQGATLDLHEESGLNALRHAGLMDAFNANFRPGADKMRIVDKHATVLVDEPVNTTELSRPEIDRGPLRKILLESLDPDTVIWNSYLLSLTPVATGWQLQFQNGTTATADIVIAADGANSKVRPFITPLKPFYSGVTMVEGSVYDSATAAPRMHALLDGGKIFAMGDEKTLIVSSKGDGSLVFYTGSKTAESWHRTNGIDFNDRAEVKAWFQQEFPGWNDVWLELFDTCSYPLTLRPQYCMPLDQTWTAQPNLTMLGDAAHVMPPYAGEGVNMAMLDALELSQCLTNDAFADVQTAIAHYEKHMLLRFAEVAQMTLDQTASLHSANGLAGMIEMFTDAERRD
ncbi:FAD-dependent oxidoreductase [Chryseolinea lacunae]|uniref:Flavin-dependent monooxygenase n=1 Tax=Chryseolinea lacunae TaxID=2801331 RepID=A0ABS1KMF8_9BACT|nr:NAD(P)/FAD-dependent oxidoreductase [Chryseolinea lacunae]MBL0740524.1 FAD-dependent monooxygenase [Chryseolinea lacunae]